MNILEPRFLKQSSLNTPLGSMIAIASDQALLLLEFHDCTGVEREIERLLQRTNSAITDGTNVPLVSIEQELKAWFDGTLKTFNTPICLLGTSFQNSVWKALRDIPYGETRSYLEQAAAIKRPSACRAVANANAANQLAIVIPCHRIIHNNGKLSGYAGGVARKQWLIEHEKRHL